MRRTIKHKAEGEKIKKKTKRIAIKIYQKFKYEIFRVIVPEIWSKKEI